MALSPQSAFNQTITAARRFWPVIGGCKAPQKSDARINSADGMFGKKDTMVLIHDFAFDDTRFELPRRVDEKDRVISLRAIRVV